MRKIKYFSTLLSLGFLTVMIWACNDAIEVEAPVLKVTAKNMTGRAGQPIRFLFSGSADIVSFYSGEVGHRYSYRDEGEEFGISKLRLSFVSQLSNMAGGKQCERRVLISTNFDGNFRDPLALMAASWIDVTDKFILANNNNETASGVVDLTEYRKEDSRLYIAFLYKHFAFPQAEGAPNWRIRELQIEGETMEGYKVIGDISDTYFSAGFNITDFATGRDMEGISLVAANYIRLAGKDGPNEKGNEIWATSRAIDPYRLRLQRELPIAIKELSDEPLQEYLYVYDEPGEYEVAFVARNTNSQNTSEIVRHITINVIE